MIIIINGLYCLREGGGGEYMHSAYYEGGTLRYSPTFTPFYVSTVISCTYMYVSSHGLGPFLFSFVSTLTVLFYIKLRTLNLSLGVLQSACSGHIENSRYLVLSNKMAPLVDLSLQLFADIVVPKDVATQHKDATATTAAATVGGASKSQATPTCGPLLNFLAAVISTLASGPLQEHDEPLLQAVTDVLR